MKIPTHVAASEIIEGKLREISHDQMYAKVVVSSTSVTLWGENGEFLQITEPPSPETHDSGEDEQEISNERSEVDNG